jgi:hypothetical protein
VDEDDSVDEDEEEIAESYHRSFPQTNLNGCSGSIFERSGAVCRKEEDENEDDVW